MTFRWTPSAVALLLTVGVGATGAVIVNCSSSEPEVLSEDALVGVDNVLGLGVLVQESKSAAEPNKVFTTLNPKESRYALKDSDQLLLRVRQGQITATSESELNCAELRDGGVVITKADVATRTASGKTVYTKGPDVSADMIALLHLYDDPNWATGNVSADKVALAKKGSAPIVEACVVESSGKVRAKLQTTLAYAWDEGVFEIGTYRPKTQSVTIASDEDGGPSDVRWVAQRQREGTMLTSQVAYAQLCMQELGEIPFFPKRAKKGRYDTFDCRDAVINKEDGSRQVVPGVESAMIPVTRDGVPVTECDPDSKLDKDSNSYSCLKNTDSGMYLASGGVQPGPMVHSAKNAEGTHWVLLCRKIADDGNGMTKSKKFNDMAMIGMNPKTGKTCFFQNAIASGTNGAEVPHPADTKISTTVWSASMQTYCTNCHGKSGFVHSRWIDGALRTNGKPIVPKMGEDPDFAISQNDRPYYVVNQDAQGFKMPQQLVSEEASACATCHRVQANRDWANFTEWSTGTGDGYMSFRSATGKKFDYAHWMPVRLDGITEASWNNSEFATAVAHIVKCSREPQTAGCEFAPIPRGNNLPARD